MISYYPNMKNFNDAFDSYHLEEYTEEVMHNVIDAVLDDILEDMGGTAN